LIPNSIDEDLVNILLELFSWNDLSRFIGIKLGVRIDTEINQNQGDRSKVGDTIDLFRRRGDLDDFIVAIFACRQNANFRELLKRVPRGLSDRAHISANTIVPQYKYCDISTFDLASTLAQTISAIPSDKLVTAISVACSVDQFVSSFCKRLKDELDRSYGPTQLRSIISLGPLRCDASTVLVKIKQVKNTLHQLNVIFPVFVDSRMSQEINEIWDEIKFQFKDGPHKLIIVIFSDSLNGFSQTIAKIPPPNFTDELIMNWMNEFRISNDWSMDFLVNWQAMCLDLCTVSGNISMARVYDHLEYLSQNIPVPPLENSMLQVMEEWRGFYVTDQI